MTEQTMVEAHQAGMAYWKRNQPITTSRYNLESLARSCGWHGEDTAAWVAGFYGAKRRAGVAAYADQLIRTYGWSEARSFANAEADPHSPIGNQDQFWSELLAEIDRYPGK
jgi:hypothetical protein